MSSTFDTDRQYYRRDLRHSARLDHAGEPRHQRSRHRQPGFPRHRLRHRQGVRHQAAARAVDAGGQRRQGHHRPVFRAQEPRAPASTNSSLPRGPEARATCVSSIFSSSTGSSTSISPTARSAPRPRSRPTSTIFEGHFPGYPLMPGVLLIETMAQTSGWLVVARQQIRPHAVSRRGEGGQVPHLRHAGPGARRSTAKLEHDGSGYAVTEAKITLRRQADLRRDAHVPRDRFPQRGDPPSTCAIRPTRIGVPSEAPADG